MEARDDGNFALSCNRMLIHGAHPILYAYCDNGRYPEETVIDTFPSLLLYTLPSSPKIKTAILSCVEDHVCT